MKKVPALILGTILLVTAAWFGWFYLWPQRSVVEFVGVDKAQNYNKYRVHLFRSDGWFDTKIKLGPKDCVDLRTGGGTVLVKVGAMQGREELDAG